MTDELIASYHELLDGTYDCVDRIVLYAYNQLGGSAGGFRTWWRRLNGGSDEELDTAHLMRLAGRFSRRVRAFAKANAIPVIDCGRDERKHKIAEPYLGEHPQARGLFLILVARAVASVWDVERSRTGTIRNLAKKRAYVNHYSFHIMDPDWGHLTIKMSGHPPFGAQVLLNGHEYVACQGAKRGLRFTKEGNCFTQVEDVAGLARVADTLSDPRAIGQLRQVCERWIYSACLCFALDSSEQRRSGFSYNYSIYQVEYSRDLLFRSGARMQQLFDRIVDRTRSRLDVPAVRTIFGAKARPHRDRSGSASIEAVIETPRYDLTWFKVAFGRLSVKAYTKGEHVLRFEATAHNTKDLKVGRALDKFTHIVTALGGLAERFCTAIDCVDIGFLSDGVLDDLPHASQLGAVRVGGIDPNKPRIHAALTAVLALATAPDGFTVGQLAAKVHTMTGHTDYTVRQAAYDLRKLRGKRLIDKPGRSRRYQLPAQ